MITQSTTLAQGLDPTKRLSQYILQSWDTENGLNSESTNTLIQSPDGYIWIGTYTGLHRFDGHHFTIFTSENSDLPSSNVLRVTLDTAGQLWVGTLHGLSTYKNGAFYTPEPLVSVKDHSIEDMIINSQNEIWFSSKSNFLFQYVGDSLIDQTTLFGFENSTVLSICEGPSNEIYFGTDDSRLIKYQNGRFEQIFQLPDLNGINDIAFHGDKGLIATGSGLFELSNEGVKQVDLLGSNHVSRIRPTGTGILWIGTSLGLVRYDTVQNSVNRLDENQGLPNNIIKDLVIDHNQNLWAGTYRGGMFYLSDGPITSYSKESGLATNIISSMVTLSDGAVLLGNENGSLNLLSDGSITDYKPSIKLPNARLKHMLRDDQNRIWISTYAGLYILDDSNSKFFNLSTGFPDNQIRMAYQDRSGSIWVGTKNAGLFRFDDSLRYKQYSMDDGLSSNYIMSITQNDAGQLIIGTISGINILDGNRIIKKIDTDNGLPSNFSFSTLAEKNRLWIASNDGLTLYQDGNITVFNQDMGLPSDIIYDVIEDDKGNFWLPSDKSIISVSKENLLQMSADSLQPLLSRQFDKSDGMKSNQCLGGVLSKIAPDGNIWIPTLAGIAMVDPIKIGEEELEANTIVESVTGTAPINKQQGQYTLPSDQDRLSIKFTGINHKKSGKLQLRYRLVPFEQEWTIADESRSVQYTNLPPSEYRFQVQTGISANYFSDKQETIIVTASWYETLIARTVFGLLLISLGYLIYLWQLRSVRSRNRALEETVQRRTEEILNQKEALSEALDDLASAQQQVVESEKMATLGLLSAGVAHEINNPLNYVKGGVDMLNSIDFTNHPDKAQIAEIIEVILTGSKRASNIVASLNEFNHQDGKENEALDLHHILDNCLVMLKHQLTSDVEVVKDFQAEGLVSGNSGRLHQAFINLLTNATHAMNGKGQLVITSRTQPLTKEIVIQIKDSGHGMKTELLEKITEPFFTTKSPGEGTGLGLSITHRIISEHNGRITFRSEEGMGTEVEVVLPVSES